MAFEKIIVLDDELIIRKSLEEQLRKHRYNVAGVSTIAQAEKLLAKDCFDLMFIDVHLPDGDGTRLLEQFAQQVESPMCIVMTGYGTIESAVKCMRLGAFDYILKPFSLDEIDVLIKKAESYSQLVKVNRYLLSAQGEQSSLLGESALVQELRSMIRKIAVTGATVLITGENGNGKELVAQELHRLSSLAKEPFIKVNCAAIAESLIESELFGHEKGVFTGAIQRRKGRFELAHNGTILLDEIGEISPRIRSKLLRVLQEKEFERIGGKRTIQINVRVLASTNRDLKKSVEQGLFREDLYYRLNVVPIHVPALRERKEDVPILAQSFLQQLEQKYGIFTKGLSKSAEELLLEHDWPGNVRELQNTLERALILTEQGHHIEVESLGILSLLNLPKPKVSSTAKNRGKEDASEDNLVSAAQILNVLIDYLKKQLSEKPRDEPIDSMLQGDEARSSSIFFEKMFGFCRFTSQVAPLKFVFQKVLFSAFFSKLEIAFCM